MWANACREPSSPSALLKFISFSAVGISLFLFVPTTIAAPPNDACNLPQGLQRKIARDYPGAKLVSLSDLSDEDKSFFTGDHGNACPGKAEVDFYGDGNPTLALALIAEKGGKEKSTLIVAHQVGSKWRTRLLDTADSAVAVVWSEDAGEYQDVYGEKKIRASHQVIVFCQYGTWSILYAWTNNRVEKIWLSD